MLAPGTPIVLKQGGLALTNTQKRSAPYNSYLAGVIQPEFPSLVGREVNAGQARVFGPGDKLWLTRISIDPKDDTVVLDLLSEDYNGTIFYGSLKFPTERGAQPDAQKTEAMIINTFSVAAPSGVAPPSKSAQTEISHTEPSAPPSLPASRTAVDGPPPTGGVFSGVTFRTIKTPEVAASLTLNFPTLVFDLNLLQSNPALLDDPPTMKYFIMLNNCAVSLSTKQIADAQQLLKIKHVLANELDYPAVTAYYKDHAAQILTDLPTAVELNMGRSQLLEYDTTRHAFPFGYKTGGRTGNGGTKPLEVPRYAAVEARGIEGDYPCGDVVVARTSKLPVQYVMDIGQARTFSEVPLDLDAAHKYLDTAPPDRPVSLSADFLISNAPAPRIEKCDVGLCAIFTSQLQKVTALGAPTARPGQQQGRPGSPLLINPGKPLAVLYP